MNEAIAAVETPLEVVSVQPKMGALVRVTADAAAGSLESTVDGTRG